MFQTTDLRTHLDELSEKMWTLISCNREFSERLLQKAQERRQKGQFRPAALASTQKVTTQIRNDEIFWLDAKLDDISVVETEVLNFLENIRSQIKEGFRVSLSEVECHFAHYEPGHFYQKHRDTTAKDNKRVFSFVYYLNANWRAEQAGELVGYENKKTLFQIQPEMGQMILFRSDLEHEVTPTQRDRWSLTGWFRK